MYTTKHQYIDRYPISMESRCLILGTIHPHEHSLFQVPFFYGNVLSLWNILSEVFPDRLTRPITLMKILSFLQEMKISMSDTIRQCEREHLSALDKDLVPTVLNDGILHDIRHSQISQILFTSGFGTNNAFKLFYEDILHRKITPSIKERRGVVLDASVFGRSIELTVLYSPSGAANRSLSKCKPYLEQRHLYMKSPRPVADWKVDYYRSYFSRYQ